MKALDILLNERMMTLVRANSQSEGQALADALIASVSKLSKLL